MIGKEKAPPRALGVGKVQFSFPPLGRKERTALRGIAHLGILRLALLPLPFHGKCGRFRRLRRRVERRGVGGPERKGQDGPGRRLR